MSSKMDAGIQEDIRDRLHPRSMSVHGPDCAPGLGWAAALAGPGERHAPPDRNLSIDARPTWSGPGLTGPGLRQAQAERHTPPPSSDLVRVPGPA